MIRMVARPTAIFVMCSAAVLGGIGTATADPGNAPNSFEVPLVCDDGSTYTVVVNGNGTFAAAHDVASTTTFIPTSFGEFTGTITDADGTVLDEFTDPAVAKGNSTKGRKSSVSCLYTVDDTFTDPELGVLSFHGEGSVIGFTTPAR